MVIKRFDMEDAPEILTLQKLAYRSEADIYGDNPIAPMTQGINEVKPPVACHGVFCKRFS